jgi:hypothetical protein
MEWLQLYTPSAANWRFGPVGMKNKSSEDTRFIWAVMALDRYHKVKRQLCPGYPPIIKLHLLNEVEENTILSPAKHQ